MSFPASGLEKMYRNDKSDIAKYLEQTHGDHYKIYNMSGRSYDTTKFKGMVEHYNWEDHHSPEMQVLFKSCHSMYEFLLEDDNNVIVVHWNAGKGRTGTSIAWFLIYSGLAENAEDAIKYYGRKRFSHGEGITQPSQIRYVKYFEKICKKEIQSPAYRKLKSLYFIGVPWLNGKSAKLFFEILDAKTMEKIYSSKNREMTNFVFENEEVDMRDWKELLPLEDMDMLVTGDLLFRIRNGSAFSQNVLCRFSINTAFCEDHMEFSIDDLDPNSFKKETRIPEYFKIGILTEPGCEKWDSSMTLSQLCQNCVRILEEEMIPWSHILGLLLDIEYSEDKKPSYERAIQLHFLGEPSDYESTLNLDTNQLPKMKGITGTIYRAGNRTQTLDINLFGRELRVTK
jgi:phosphatidylinositol-3,4,5-trisphosphate 3-phosphatase and dual-specificity protein phosphatase PTEN